MRASLRPSWLAALALAPLAAACGTSRPVREGTPAPSPACTVVDAVPGGPAVPGSPAAPAGELRFALPDPVSPAHAPAGRDDGERLVYGLLYRTLVEVDCEGRVRPGLAEAWSHDGDGLRWRFTLRPDARFWDGSPVTARDVARAWATGAPPAGRPRSGPAIASASAHGERELSVLLGEPITAIEAFADAALAVTGPPTGAGWPGGTGPFRPEAAAGDPPRSVRLVAVDEGAAPGTITFGPWPAHDARAALDAGADALMSLDPEVIAYARALPDFVAVPLPWSRTYVVAAPPGRWSEGDAPASRPPAEALDGLARGAVRVDARPAEPPWWWARDACVDGQAISADPASEASAEPVRSGGAGALRIAYPLGDGVARGIAERLVALAGRGEAAPSWVSSAAPGLREARGGVVAVGMEPGALARAARRSEAVAFVVPLPRAPGGPCLSRIIAAGDPVADAVLAGRGGLRLTPLVDVRPSLVIRRGVAGVSVHGDGTLSFDRGGGTP